MATEGAVAEAPPPPNLGDYARFVSPSPAPSGGSPAPSPSPTPDLGDYAQFVNPSPTAPPADLGDYAQFVSPTPHSENVVAQTHAVADQVDASNEMVIPRMGTMGVSSELMGLDANQPIPQWAQNAMEGLGEAALGFAPKSIPEAAKMSSPVFGSYDELSADAKTVADLVSGKPFDQAFVDSHPDVPELEQANQTPPFSKERFKAGFTMLGKFGMLAGGESQLKGGEPSATQKVNIQESIRTEPQDGTQSAQATQAGVSDSLQPAAPVGTQEVATTENFLGRARGQETPSQPAIEGGAIPEAAPSQGGAAPLSIGMASPEEFMQRYASHGASQILAGNTTEAGFANSVKAEFGSHINDLVPEIRQRSQQLINDLQTAAGKTDVSREINQLVGVTKLIEQPQRVRLFSALRDSLRRQEKAGEAGFKRGFKEASVIGNEKTRQMRLKARTADAFLAADAQAIRDSMVDYAKNLPLNERGKYIPAITSALRRTPLWSSDPGVMYRRAEAVLNRMTESLYNVEKKAVTEDIAKRLAKIEASPTISVAQKQAARQMATTFNNLKGKMSFDMLNRMHDSIKQLEALGKDLFLLDDTIREAKTEAALTEIENQGTLHLDKPVPVKVPIGEERSYVQGQVDKLRAIPSFFRHFNLTWTPMDFVFQTFDQQLNGALYRTMKLPIDAKFSNFLDISHAYKERLSAIVRKNGLTDGQLNRITAVAELRQDGGLENLMSRGFTEQELKSIRLTKPELEYLREADKINGELLPKIKEVMKKEFNLEVEDVQGYFPRQRDWDYYDSLSITEGKFSESMRRSTPAKGHTISRVGAVTKNILNAHEIMMKHLDDAIYHMVMAPEIRRVADVIKADEFKDQVGTWGQKVFADWLDVVARNGGIESARKIRVIDTVRKNVGMAQLAFRLTTTMLQPLSIIDGMAYVSPKEMARSITRVALKDNRQWVLKNFPEIRERVGDDPAYTDYKTGSVRDVLARTGFKGIASLDRFAALTVADGAYRDYLNDHGIAFDPKNVNSDAVNYAQYVVRKSQSTALPKDVPQAISRGAFSGNASFDKAIGQFQNFMVRRWASIKNDGLQMGIKDKSIKAGARVMGFIVLATIAEQLGREGIKALVRTAVGESSSDKNRRENDPAFAQRVSQNAALDFSTSIPAVSNLVGAIRYQGTGIPALDVAGKGYKGINQIMTGKSPESKAVGAVRLGQAAGALVGVPTGQVGDLIIKWIQGQESGSTTGTIPFKSPKAKKSR